LVGDAIAAKRGLDLLEREGLAHGRVEIDGGDESGIIGNEVEVTSPQFLTTLGM